MISILPTAKVNEKSFLDIGLELADNPESLAEFVKSSYISPMVLVEEQINRMDPDVRNDILQAHLSLYAGWYLMASVHRIKIDGVTVSELLNPLSTSPSVRNSLRIGLESVKTDKDVSKGLTLESLGMENARNSIDQLNKNSNLMVGKIINVPLSVDGITEGDGSKDVTVPVQVRLSPRTADIDFMVDLFKYINKDKGWVERYHQWQSGEIKSLTDYLFARDLIEEERKLMLKDKDGIYSEGKARRAKGILSTILSGNKAINVASTITILTKQSASRLEAVMDGRGLRDYRSRQKFFEETGSMILTIVNPDRNTLTVYTRGYEEEAIWSFRDIKNMGSSANSGIDMSSIVSSLMQGRMPGSR